METRKLAHIVHLVDGHADPVDDPKPAEDEDPKPAEDQDPKPKDEDGNKPKDPKEQEKPAEPVDASKLSIDELKKLNPEVAKLISESDDAREKLEEAERKRQEDEEESLKKKGEWQKLAESEKEKRKKAESEANKKSDLLDKYKGTVDGLVKDVMEKIPEEKQTLIPSNFSNRQKLEYVQQNASWFGIKSVVDSGGRVPPNNEDPAVDEEAKLTKELNDLVAKGGERTPVEDKKMSELGTKIKEIRKNKKD